MYRSDSSSPQYGNDVSVMALSDSDTTASPTLGSSSASEKFRDLRDAEPFSLSFDGRSIGSSHSDKSDRKSYTPEVKSVISSTEDDTSADNETVIVHDDDDDEQEALFKRNGENRNSDISDNSSISQGIQADKDFEKHGSDMSDVSGGRLTPKNGKDLESYLQVTDESGIVSETTSSNHSEGSQQSDQSNYRFDPSEIAQKIMCDVSEHKSALDSMQKLSMIQSQAEANILRSEYQKQNKPISVPQLSGISDQTGSDKPSSGQTNSVQSKIAAFSSTNNTSGQSAFTSPTHKGRLPPPVAVKPAFQSNTSNLRSMSANVSNLSTIPGPESAQKSDLQTLPESSFVSSDSNVFTTTAIVVSKQDSFSSSANTKTTMSFSSFRPSGKPLPAESVSNIVQYRPESTASTSSHCSTPSSMQSVIYRPYGEKAAPESPCVVSYDSSSEQTSGSGSTSTITPTVSLSDKNDSLPNDFNSSAKRDSSPALSSCSSTSGRSGKQKKKVSFSDSEPSDTPSPLDSSASSNQFSYFDTKKSSPAHIPPRIGNLQPNMLVPNSRHSSSSSIDSVGKRPPPPSYQYAIRNSQLLQQKSPQLPARLVQGKPLNYSSPSSPNDSIDEINNMPQAQMSPSRFSSVPMNQSAYQPQNQSSAPSNSRLSHGPNQSTSHPLNQSMPAGSSFAQNFTHNPSQSFPPQQMSPVRNVRNTGLSPVRQPPSSPNSAPLSSPQPKTPEIPPRGIAPAHVRKPYPTPGEPISNGPLLNSASMTTTGSNPPNYSVGSRSQLSPRHQSQVPQRSLMAPINEQIANDISMRPKNLPISNQDPTTKPALLRQPLSSPEKTLSPQEYVPPQYYESGGSYHGNQGQGSLVGSFGQNNIRSQSMDYISKYNQNDQNKQLPQSYELKDFPSQFSSSPALNLSSPSHSRGGPHIPSANQIRESLMNRNSSANQIYSGQGMTNRNAETGLRMPPAPPARIDSWENMGKHLNNLPAEQQFKNNYNSEQNIPLQTMYRHDQMRTNEQNSHLKISGQNGYLRDQTGNQGNQLYHRQTNGYPAQNGPMNSAGHFQNGNLNTVPHSPNTGPLRRVGLGSDKKSFAKTNVIQASKC